MNTNWPYLNQMLFGILSGYRKGAQEIAASFSELAKTAIKPGAVDPKTNELMALAFGIAARCDGCIGVHTEAAIRHGATREEIIETIGVAVNMGGGPSYVNGS